MAIDDLSDEIGQIAHDPALMGLIDIRISALLVKSVLGLDS